MGWSDQLKDQLCSQLEHTRIVGSCNSTKVACAQVRTYAAIYTGRSKLGVVPSIEALGPELKAAAASFTDEEALEQREIPVITARSTECVMSQSAPSPVGRECERRWVEPLVDRLGIGNISIPVWPILYVATREDAGDGCIFPPSVFSPLGRFDPCFLSPVRSKSTQQSAFGVSRGNIGSTGGLLTVECSRFYAARTS